MISDHSDDLGREIERLMSPSPTTAAMAGEESPVVRPHKKKHQHASAGSDVQYECTPGTGGAEIGPHNEKKHHRRNK